MTTPKPPPVKLIQVRRELVIEGPEDAVMDIVKRAWVSPGNPHQIRDVTITETSRNVRVKGIAS